MESSNSDANLALLPAPVSPWTWSRIHYSATTPLSRRIHPFLAGREDPRHPSRGIETQGNQLYVMAGAGGLVVLVREPTLARIEALAASRRIGRRMESESGSRLEANPEPGRSITFFDNWHPLLVFNPLSNERRVLPAADSRDVGWSWWDYSAVVVHFLVDEQSKTYKLTLTFPTCVCVYMSNSNRWRCMRFPQPGPWGTVSQNDISELWGYVCGRASMDGRIFLAEVEPEPCTSIRIFEIDSEAGEWKLHNWTYSLQSWYWDFLQTPILRNRGLTDRNRALRDCNHGHDKRVLRHLGLVECMGDLYAVIPARLDEYLPMSFTSLRTLVEVVHEYPNFGLEFLPLQFLIVQLQGDGFVHGVLRILVPDNLVRQCYGNAYDDVGNQRRKQSLLVMTGQGAPSDPDEGWDFSCTAEESVIWVAVQDYLLQYDVATGQSKTEVIVSGYECGQSLTVMGVPYRPSNMRP